MPKNLDYCRNAAPRIPSPFSAGPITKHGDIDYEAVVKLSDGFNGADLRNVCTEAGLFAIR
jgi:ATP-dependent 26S proteasome regulatory subunit